MKRKPPIIPLVVLATLIGLGVYVDRQRAEKRSLISGVFETQPTQVSSRQSGRVARILVKEGQTVRKGDRLVQLEAQVDALQEYALDATARAAEARRDETVAGPRAEEIARQRAVVEELTANLDKAQNGPRKSEILQAAARLRQAEARLTEARNGPRPQEIQQAQATVWQAEAVVAAATRGATQEERAQLAARLDSARAQESYAVQEASRKEALYKEGGISRREADAAQAQATSATASRREAEQAALRAQRGTPAEELDQSRRALESSQARLALLKAGTRPEEIRSAEADVAVARESLRLLQQGTRTEDVRAVAAALAQQQAVLRQLQNGSRKEEVDQAAATAVAARFSHRSAAARRSESILVAPIDGVVDRIFVADGDLVNAGTMVTRLNNPGDIWIRVFVPEPILVQFKVGDPAMLKIDGLNGDTEGIVESIATDGEYTPANLQTPEERGKQVFAVRIRLTKPNAAIKAGMTATVKSLGSWK